MAYSQTDYSVVDGTATAPPAVGTPVPTVTAAKLNKGEAGIAAAQAAAEAAQAGVNAITDVSGDVAVIKEAPLNVELAPYSASTSKTAAQNATAIQAAINALPVEGGTLLLPRTYNCDPVTVADKRGVTLQGLGGMTAGAAARSGLNYAGTATRFIDARSSTGFWMRDLYLQQTNAAFTGYLVDYTQSASLLDSSYGGMERVQIVGVRTGAAGLRLDKAIIMAFRDCKIGGFIRGAIGKESLGSYSNAITFDGCTLIGNVSSHLLNAAEDWRLIGNTYEHLSLTDGTTAGAGALVCAYPVKGLSIIGGWCGDATTAGTWFDVQGNGICILGTYIGSGQTGVRFDAGNTSGALVAACFDQNTFGIVVDSGGGFTYRDLNLEQSAFMSHTADNRIVWGAAAPVATKTVSYTLAIGDVGKLLEMNSASAQVFTIPPNSSVPFPIGTTIELMRLGAGTVTITPGAGVTIPNSIQAAGTSSRTITAQYLSASLYKRATDVWVLSGSIA